MAEHGVLTAPTQIWETAVRQAEVIGPLAAKDTVGLADADAAAERLRVSRRQVYVLLGRWRAGEGVVSDLLPSRSSGGRGGGRLPGEVEAIVQEVLRTRYLVQQRRNVADEGIGRIAFLLLALFAEMNAPSPPNGSPTPAPSPRPPAAASAALVLEEPGVLDVRGVLRTATCGFASDSGVFAELSQLVIFESDAASCCGPRRALAEHRADFPLFVRSLRCRLSVVGVRVGTDRKAGAAVRIFDARCSVAWPAPTGAAGAPERGRAPSGHTSVNVPYAPACSSVRNSTGTNRIVASTDGRPAIFP
ncbi:helix-turn-helix domain-containing protein [Streptomyces lydicus]|uniref:helix-turn-helix domain-containing protein n=1 Tax=Streptomyces lydicus TaxID=47763 RepID=UPI001AD84DC9|nr:helix-turn-helix domain-containing protein [Streptomyces lydicus]